MKVNFKFGLGEIVYYSHHGKRNGQAKHDDFLDVIELKLSKVGPSYVCRYPNGVISVFAEDELTNDPDYDQEKGGYLNDD